ncbi:MAG: orotidine 5'-phosphate decarboxylase / HUMPS family protein [Anaerolineales bacterium]
MPNLDPKVRYLQIAFNYDLSLTKKIIPLIARSDRILIEAGTPFIKREGMKGISAIRALWAGHLVADIKTADGAEGEVEMVKKTGATAITVLGSSPVETLDIFVNLCQQNGLDSMIDMIGVDDPLKVVRQLRRPPNVVVLHRGRDEETTRGKVIQYRHINRLLSKYNILISAAGGVDLKEARSAIFNGANIVVVNLVRPNDPWLGIRTDSDIGLTSRLFLDTIE